MLERFLPPAHVLREHKFLRRFGARLTYPNVWHLNRRSAAGGLAIGLFMAFVPMPLQTIPAAALALLFRVNLPAAVAGAWVTNPITVPPLAYFCYRLGAWLLDTPVPDVAFDFSLAWLGSEFGRIWRPFVLGCFLVGAASALVGYFGVRALWRLQVVREWERRKHAPRMKQ